MNDKKTNNFGLLKHDDKIYQLVGFFHNSCTYESDHKMIADLPFNQYYINNYDFINEFDFWQPISNYQQLLQFGLDPKNHLVIPAYNSSSFVFSRCKSKISFNDLRTISKDYKRAVLEYVKANEKVKLIATPHRIIKGARDKANGKDTIYKNYMDLKSIQKSFNPIVLTKIKKENEDVNQKESKHYDRKQKIIMESVKRTSTLKGGTIDVKYESEHYSIPLLPLLAWNQSIKSKSFDFYLWTWFFEYDILTELILGSELDSNFILNLPIELSELFKLTASKIDEAQF